MLRSHRKKYKRINFFEKKYFLLEFKVVFNSQQLPLNKTKKKKHLKNEVVKKFCFHKNIFLVLFKLYMQK